MASYPDGKLCKCCGEIKPENAFSRHRKRSENGKIYMFIRNMCKPCDNAYRKEQRDKKLVPVSEQVCLTCDKIFIPSNRKMKYCSPSCCNMASKQRNRTVKQTVMQFLSCDHCGKQFLYATRNKHVCDECKLENKRQYSRDQMRQWRIENPEEEAKRVRISGMRRDHRKRQLPATLTVAEWESALEYFECSCAYCGKPSDNLHQEHFMPLAKGGGYTKDNIVPACSECNQSKSDIMPRDWLPEDVYTVVSAYLRE